MTQTDGRQSSATSPARGLGRGRRARRPARRSSPRPGRARCCRRLRRDRPGHGLGGGRDDGRGRVPARRSDRRPLPVTVDSRQACAAFAAEGLFTPVGWERPDIWDPIAGNYQARDGWIRLHTNYAYHRAAVERLLGAADRESRPGGGGGVEGRGPRDRGRRGGRLRGGHARPARTGWPPRRAPPPATRRCAGRRRSPAGRTPAPVPAARRGRSARPGGRIAGRARARPHPRHRRARSAPGSWPPTAPTCSGSTRPDSPRCPRCCRRRRRASGPPRSISRRRRPGGLRVPRRRRRRPGHRAARGRARPARLRRRRAGRPEPGADRGLARRLRMGRPVAGPPRIRQPGADELRASRRPAPPRRGGPPGAAAGAGGVGPKIDATLTGVPPQLDTREHAPTRSEESPSGPITLAMPGRDHSTERT